MSAPPPRGRPTGEGTDRSSRIQLIAILAVTLVVMILGVAVVLFPRQLGVPQPLPATPTVESVATPAGTPTSSS